MRLLLSRILLLAAFVSLSWCQVSLAQSAPDSRLRILVIGGHPDDPESCAGGLLALAAAAGHDVSAVYLTTGEAGIPGTPAAAAAAIRKKEAERACAILGVKPVFFGEIDGATVVDQARYRKMAEFLQAEKPDLVVTHWPIDTHADHRAAWNLVYQAWYWGGKKFALYYMEAMSGHQSLGFHPTDRLDIGPMLARKHDACFAHASQGLTPASYEGEILHGQMERFRGIEGGFSHGEAYARQDQSLSVNLAAICAPREASAKTTP